MPNKTDSEVMAFMRLLWDGASKATGHSWTRFNQALRQALMAAIRAGMRFTLYDFGCLYADFGGGYWFGTDNDHSQGEGFYSQAVEVDNLSACQSFEQWKERPSFMYQGKRLCHGSEFTWQGFPCQVTSFSQDRQSLIACTYWLKGPEGKLLKIKEGIGKRFRIGIEELRSVEKAKRKAKKEAV